MAKLVMIKLSRRNLTYLLHPSKDGFRSIVKPGTNGCLTIVETDRGNDRIIIDTLPDSLIYRNREPGPMNSQSEAFVKRLEAFLEKDFAEYGNAEADSHDAQMPGA